MIKKSPYIIMLWILLGLIAGFELVPLLGLVDRPCFHETLLKNVFNTYLGPASCLGGALAYFLILPIKKHELIGVTVLGLIFELILRHYRPLVIASIVNYKPDIALFNQFLFLGPGLLAACLLAILWRTWQAYKANDRDRLNRCLETLFLSIAMPSLLCFNGLISGCYVYDPHLYALDSLWGVQVSFIVAKVIRNHTICAKFMEIVYSYLPVWMIVAQIVVYKDNLQNKREHICSLIPAFLFILIAIGGELCYNFIPAVGVELYCGTDSFPNGPWPAANMNPQPIEAPYYLYRNCMPSLHFAWILSVYYSVYSSKSIYKNTALALVVLTVLSTFSVGCHYLIDLIIAVPFTMAILAAVTPKVSKKLRLTGVSFGLISVSVWLCLFKYSVASILRAQTLTLSLLITTVLIAFYLAYAICNQAKSSLLKITPELQQEATPPC